MVILREKAEKEHSISCMRGARFLNMADCRHRKIIKIGFAVDLGTTSIAAAGFVFFENIEHPVYLGKLTKTNAQTKLGSDVMMRVMHAVMGKGKQLQEMVVSQIEEMADEIINRNDDLDAYKLSGEQIEFVIVGNTTMCHLFLGENVEGLGGAPFQPAYHGNRIMKGEQLGFLKYASARFFVLAGIASHVGSDALSVICETGIRNEKKISLAIDLGTNAEIALNKNGRIWCASAAAGPAFEGREVACGKPAGPGVITGIKISGNNGNIILDYIPGKEIHGICGSGCIDALARLLKLGIVKKDGYMLSKQEIMACSRLRIFEEYFIEDSRGQEAFCFYKGRKNVYLIQKDIRNMQLAKGAIMAAITVLLRETGTREKDLDYILLTGVLGSNIRLNNAVDLGLVPNLPKEQFVFVPDAALRGAVTLLLQPELRGRWEEEGKNVKHVELTQMEDFQKIFMQSLELSDCHYSQ